MEKYNLILKNEEYFARAVALGLWVKRPISSWYYLLPGMFIIEYLKRSSAIKFYAETFLFPRKLALDLGLRFVQGDEKGQLLREAKGTVNNWLTRVKMFSPKIQEKHIEQVEILLSHYGRLLQAKGENYSELIKNTYLTKENYENFLAELISAENRVDAAIAEFFRETEQIWRRLRSEQEQVAFLRKKQVEQIFPEI